MPPAEQFNMYSICSIRVIVYSLVVVSCAVVLASCLELKETITIRPDGSGTQTLRMCIPERILKDIEAKSAVLSQTGKRQDVLAIFHRAKAEKEFREAGLRLLRHKAGEQRRGRTVDLEAEFKSLKELRRSPLAPGAADWLFEPGKIKGTTRLIYYPLGKASFDEAKKRLSKLDEKADDPVIRHWFEKKRGEISGLDISLTLNLPGMVLAKSKNMEETGLSQVTARIRESDIRNPRDLILALAPRYEVVFISRRCSFPLDKKVAK